jgi:hypothetical protein
MTQSTADIGTVFSSGLDGAGSALGIKGRIKGVSITFVFPAHRLHNSRC